MDMDMIYRAQMLQKESEESERNLQMVEEQISELELFEKNLGELKDSKGKEMLASLGKGVYIKSDIKEEKLFVEVGAGVVVRKTREETKKTIEGQIRRLKEVRIQLIGQLEEFKMSFGEMVREIEGENKVNS